MRGGYSHSLRRSYYGVESRKGARACTQHQSGRARTATRTYRAVCNEFKSNHSNELSTIDFHDVNLKVSDLYPVSSSVRRIERSVEWTVYLFVFCLCLLRSMSDIRFYLKLIGFTESLIGYAFAGVKCTRELTSYSICLVLLQVVDSDSCEIVTKP